MNYCFDGVHVTLETKYHNEKLEFQKKVVLSERLFMYVLKKHTYI